MHNPPIELHLNAHASLDNISFGYVRPQEIVNKTN